MKRLIALLTLLPLLGMGGGQYTIPWHTGATAAAAASCTALPSAQITYQFLPDSGCSTSHSCMTDAVGGNSATQTVSGNLPTYNSTGGPNSVPDIAFNGSSSYLNMTTAIPSTVSTYTFWVVLNTSTNTSVQYLFGSSVTSSGIGYSLRATSVMSLIQQGVAVLAADTVTLNNSTWYAKLITYNNSTNAYAFYTCAGGTCTLGGNGTATAATLGQTINEISGTIASSLYLNGGIAEIGFYNGIWDSTKISNYGTWTYCKYGL